METHPYELNALKHSQDMLSETIMPMSPLQWLIGSLLLVIMIVSGTRLVYQANNRVLIDMPRDGGTYTEGIVGTPRFINPLLAISNADRDLTAVVYAGLMKRDNKNVLLPELAESYSISDDGTTYTFILKQGLLFHDGTPLTASDVVYTVTQAAHTAIRSPLYANWEGVGVEEINERTVTFTLPEPYAPFIENTTIGILPKHIWAPLADDQFSFSQFNVEPIGAGPYRITRVVVDKSGIPERYELAAYDSYTLGKPHIANFHFYLYRDKADAFSAFTRGTIDALYGLDPQSIEELLQNDTTHDLSILRAPQLRVFGVFFNQSQQPLFIQKTVREALNEATPRQAIVGEILKGYGTVLSAPVPPHLLTELSENSNTLDTEVNTTETSSISDGEHIERARKILEDAGWTRNASDQVYELTQNDKTLRLAFTLSTTDTPELATTAERVAKAWREVGAQVEVKVFNANDLTQSAIRPRKYDALLFGLELGHELDLYAFWHSSQRNDPGLNISQFVDIEADAALTALRTSNKPDERLEYLKAFLSRVEHERAGIFIYAPNFTYLMRTKPHNTTLHPIAIPSERFDTVHEWHIETDRVWPIVKNLLD